MKSLFTIGYERHSVEALIGILQSHSIEHVVDIRRVPHSRKRGFSKQQLAQALQAAGLGYTHMVELGTPPALRQQLKDNYDYNSFFEGVEAYIETQEAALYNVLALASTANIALLCLEDNSEYCHRSTVAGKLVQISQLQLQVEDL